MTVQAGERTPFIGREPELAHLRRLLDRAVVGRGGLALIAGDPGIGKTRLAQEAVAEAASRGVRPLTGHCVDRQGSPPYLPFVEILETLQRHLPPTSFRQVLGNAAGEMARLLPGLRHSWPALPAPLELPPEQERRYLFNCFAEVLLRVSNLAPLMLVLEDLQWADEATLLLLEHVSRHVAETPLLILGTYRDRETAENHFRHALQLAEALPHRIDQGDVRRLHALMLIRRDGVGDAAAARQLLQEAAAVYSEIGMRRHVDLAQMLLADLRSRHAGRRPRGRHPDGLTEREAEVLTLLAAGRTSKEVARQLSLSITTVHRHIANIYAKIGASNRAEATAYVLRGGIERPPT